MFYSDVAVILTVVSSIEDSGSVTLYLRPVVWRLPQGRRRAWLAALGLGLCRVLRAVPLRLRFGLHLQRGVGEPFIERRGAAARRGGGGADGTFPRHR
jgi:hypothetical protein